MVRFNAPGAVLAVGAVGRCKGRGQSKCTASNELGAGKGDAASCQPVPILQLLVGGDPPRGDDVRPLSAQLAERGRPAVRARDRHLPRDGPALVLGWTAPNGIAMCQSEFVEGLNRGGPPVEKITRVGMDTSKRVFQLHGVNAAEQPVLRIRAQAIGGDRIHLGTELA